MTLTIGPKKLPKRAVDAIARAKEETEHWKAKALAATGEGTSGTNVRLYGGGVEPDRGLPPNSVIEFEVGGECLRVSIEEAARGGPSLTIYAPGGSLMVRPASSNVVLVQGK